MEKVLLSPLLFFNDIQGGMHGGQMAEKRCIL